MNVLKIDLDTTIDEVSSALEDLASTSASYLMREGNETLADLDAQFKIFKDKLKEARKKGDFYRASIVDGGEESEEDGDENEE